MTLIDSQWTISLAQLISICPRCHSRGTSFVSRCRCCDSMAGNFSPTDLKLRLANPDLVQEIGFVTLAISLKPLTKAQVTRRPAFWYSDPFSPLQLMKRKDHTSNVLTWKTPGSHKKRSGKSPFWSDRLWVLSHFCSNFRTCKRYSCCTSGSEGLEAGPSQPECSKTGSLREVQIGR